MREADATTRERMADRLREETLSLSALATEFDTTAEVALSHVQHVARSLDGTGEQLLAAPPECRDCGFTDFDDLANRPSRCPECKSESIEEPSFKVE
ncbi:transcriptional regulator [Halostella sp. JP-L12]|uniref:transcriptional regulator n=1 Tax=Halostella TaxID=1843185 RepID=UPI000EF77637|nr:MULTISPECIES: transcriptional regulator [Halostella]NHN47618.1 transcriptional regulator [Halostella sp. JP-L12]